MLKNKKETLLYLIFGGMTTLINFGVFTLWLRLFGESQSIMGNAVGFVFAVTFAFFTNKRFVFESKSWERKVVLKEGASFLSARLLSFGFEELCLFIATVPLQLDERFWMGINVIYIVKLVLAVLVVIINYVVSKLWIFKKK